MCFDRHRQSFDEPGALGVGDSIRLEYFHTNGSAGIDLTWDAPVAILRDEAVQVAKQSNVIIAFVGHSPSLEGEEMRVGSGPLCTA